ncbi:hypothetical protein [Nitrosomonas oligotropha]|uniref:Uncharacterized protein n=1 Tax=Nitrosomonas oligotropha TaxID=42354 RepID=A0A1H8V4Y3_9PROT|nr:hypothetical protein [Nitrosomonas oligotropha]SDX54144.1 hypothetical protein SAMN05216300_1483 [Nitrosomonas oligotropha]SEP10562.1 hypothetical protein SAMN05216333_1463 [Nitrosomonas oligotropha]
MTKNDTISDPQTILGLFENGAVSNTELPLTLSAGQEIKFSLSTPDGKPTIGVVDVIHQNPQSKGKGDLRITWQETLEWGPNPNTPGDSWQKTVTIKNCSKSTQDVIFRFFSFEQKIK